MSSRLEKQDRDDAIHSILVLLLVGIVGISYYIGLQHKQQEIEDKVKSTQMTVEENARIEEILFGGRQGED